MPFHTFSYLDSFYASYYRVNLNIYILQNFQYRYIKKWICEKIISGSDSLYKLFAIKIDLSRHKWVKSHHRHRLSHQRQSDKLPAFYFYQEMKYINFILTFSAYGSLAKRHTFIDGIFGGYLISIVSCQECDKVGGINLLNGFSFQEHRTHLQYTACTLALRFKPAAVFFRWPCWLLMSSIKATNAGRGIYNTLPKDVFSLR
jgi:hypothetical protein